LLPVFGWLFLSTSAYAQSNSGTGDQDIIYCKMNNSSSSPQFPSLDALIDNHNAELMAGASANNAPTYFFQWRGAWADNGGGWQIRYAEIYNRYNKFWALPQCYRRVPICDYNTAKNFVDAANAESSGPVVLGPYAKPAGGYGLRISVGYQTDNYCQFGCQMTNLTTQDVSEDEYSYAVTTNETLHVQNRSCSTQNGPQPFANQSQVTDYYIAPSAEWDLPPVRDPVTPPPDYPPDAPPPPPESPPPPPELPPPPEPPCLKNCTPVTPPKGEEAPPEIPPFEAKDPPVEKLVIKPLPPVVAGPPLPSGDPECKGSYCSGEPAGGCPAGTSFGAMNSVNGCYGEPSGQCAEGQYYGSVDGKNGCYGSQACKSGEVFGSIGNEEAKCHALESCYVKGTCNEECNPETETCDPVTGGLSEDCRVQPECGKADAIECAILRQNWAGMCRKGSSVEGAADCSATLKCEGGPIECALLSVERERACQLEPDVLKSGMIQAFTDAGMAPVGEFTDEDIFITHDGGAMIGDFLDADSRAGSCPPDLTVPVFGKAVVISLSPLCALAVYIRALILLSASYFGLMIFYRSFVSS
tara:strand:+ start:384 stop:2135 length:1752 start_codon:yes stop_codon:yes gene_type:complete